MEKGTGQNQINNCLYKQVIEQSPIGYLYGRIICDDNDNPIDYEIIETNSAFEIFTGYEASELIGKKKSEIRFKYKIENDFDWKSFYGETALNGGTKSTEQFYKPLNRWYREFVFSPKKSYFASLIIDVTDQKETNRRLYESEAKFRAISESALDAIVLMNNKGQIMYWSPTAEKIFGYTEEEIIGLDVHKVLMPDKYRKKFDKGFHKFLHTGDGPVIGKLIELTANHKTGREIPIEMALSPVNMYGECWVSSIIRDITERKEAAEIIFNESEKFKATLFSVGDGVIATDYNGVIIVMNKSAEKITGWTQKQAVGRPLEEVFNIINEFTKETCKNPAQEVLKTGKIIEISNNTMLVSKSGREISIEQSAAPIKDRNKNTTGVVIVFRDTTEKKEKQRQIEYLSFHDYLTGLYNRRFLEDAVVKMDNETNWPLTIMEIDVNGLKRTNDKYGHAMGDLLIKTVADIITKVCNKGEIAARIGGDEFVILLPKTDKIYAEYIKRKINDTANETKLESVNLSAAIGYAIKTNAGQNLTDIQKEADNNMYKDKLRSYANI